MATTIKSLPNEILFDIASLLKPSRHQNRDLSNLALTCRCLRPIAQEVLICSPRFYATQAYNYIRALTQHADLIPKVKSLELWSSLYHDKYLAGSAYNRPTSILQWVRAMQHPEDMEERMRVFSMRLKDAMQSLICVSTYVNPLRDVTEWEEKLDHYVIPATLALLLSILTGLKELKLAGTETTHTPFFHLLLLGLADQDADSYDEDADCDEDTRLNCEMASKRKELELTSKPILKLLKEKLEVFEYPKDMAWFVSSWRIRDMMGFRDFGALKILSVPLTLFRSSRPMIAALPETIVCLRVTEVEQQMGWFVRELCRARKNGLFTDLKRLEMYYPPEMMQYHYPEVPRPKPWSGLPAICAEVGVEPSNTGTWEEGLTGRNYTAVNRRLFSR